VKQLGAVIVAVALMALVFRLTGLNVAAIRDVLSDVSFGAAALAFVVYGSSYLGRASRLAVLLNQPPGMLHLASISARHNFFNLVLPFRTGEASLPIMLRNEAGHSLAEGAATLFVCRLLDLISVIAFLLLGLALRPNISSEILPPVLGVLGGALLVLLFRRPLAALLARRLQPRGRLTRFLAAGAEHLAAVTTRRLVGASVISLGTWGLTYGACYLLVLAMGNASAPPGSVGAELAAVDIPTALIGTTGLHLTAILPINTPGGVGAWEAGWTAGYRLAGVPGLAAAASAVGSHVLIFGFVSVLGVLALLLRPTPARPGPRAASL
jgi:uncharacterized protein (TIRG00374 family)